MDGAGKEVMDQMRKEAQLIDDSEFQQRLHEYYENGQYTDITIAVEGKEYRCHKVVLAAWSHYFADMFNTSYAESHQDKIQLHDVSQVAFEEILKFCYSRESTIAAENVYTIYQTAHYPSFDKVEKNCLKFMSKCSDLKYFYLITQKNDKTLINLILSNVAHNFSSLWKTPEFTECPQSELEMLLSHRHLMVDSEYEVLQALMKWLDCNHVTVTEKMKLVKCIRFHLFTPEEWNMLRQSDLCKDIECLRYVTSLLLYGAHPYGRPGMVEEKQNEPRGCYSLLLVRLYAFYGDEKTVHVFPIDSHHAVDVAAVEQPPKWTITDVYDHYNYTAFTINNFFYILDAKMFTRYCPLENVWIELEKMSHARKEFSATVTKTSIYIFGGLSENPGVYPHQTTESLVREVEEYDLKTNKWQTLAELDDNMPSTIKAAAVGEEIYVLYNQTIGIFNKVTGQCDEIEMSSLDSKSCAAVVAGNLIYFAGYGQPVERFDTTTRSITAIYKLQTLEQKIHLIPDEDEDNLRSRFNCEGVYYEDIHSGEKQMYMIGDVVRPNFGRNTHSLYRITLNDDTHTYSVSNIIADGYSGMGLVALKSKCSFC